MQDEEFIQSFIEESKVHVETVETELLNINIDDIDVESINNIFRAVHSVKGTAGFFDFKKIVALSHVLENLFGEIRAGNLKITSEMVDILLAANDCLSSMIDDVMNSENTEIDEFVATLSHFLNGEKPQVAEIEITEIEEGDFFDIDNFRAPEAIRKKIKSELNRGCKLFLLKRKLYGDLINKDSSLVELLKEVASYGSLIDCHVDTEKLLSDSSDVDLGAIDSEVDAKIEKSDINIEILFTTVLEMDFLPSEINEPAENLVELLLRPEAKNMKDSNNAQDSKDKEESMVTKAVVSASASASLKTGPEKIIISANEDLPVEIFHEEQDKEKQKGPSVMAEDSIRVNVTLLNGLLNMSSEMVLARNQLLRTMEKYRKGIPGIDVIFGNINHITTNLQETIMQTRMQPVSNVFNKFPRIARELSKKMSKDITLELEGTEVELDKSIIEALGDPLTHLVRNAVDHGLEMPEERLNSGKTRMGTIKLKAYHESGYVNIDVIDDGKGINTEIIRRKAFEKGFISKADMSVLGEQESLQLLFKPGFSTADEITDISGRGVGMDVVKTNIEKLGGKIEIFTNIGKGTTFRLLLPLTLAIIPSLIVEAENQKFALPQINVQEIVRIKASDPARRIEFINNSEVLRLRGKLLPIVQLADVLGLKKTFVDPETGERLTDKRKRLFDDRRSSEMIAAEAAEATAAAEKAMAEGTNKIVERRGYKMTNIIRILVIKIGSRRLGLSVDTIHGSEEILVKTLPIHVKECKNYSGVTILGDGKAAMILDPSGIIENSNLRYIDGQYEAKNKLQISEAEKMRESQNLLLFKCSGPETLALDMAMVSRVEEINPGDIEMIGKQEFIRFRGESLRIIRPEDFLPIKKQDNSDQAQGKCYVIIPKLVKHPMGILIEKMHDTIQISVNITGDDSIVAKGIIGSTIVNDRIILLMNIYELFELANPDLYKIETAIKHKEQIKILLVEDTPFFQKLEKDYLENAGYDVTVAEHGKIALEIMRSQKFDVIVSDINMPEMNGIELIKRIRADKSLCDLPVIAVTSLTGELQKKEGLAAGFDSYEFKLDRARLIEIIEETLNKRRQNA